MGNGFLVRWLSRPMKIIARRKDRKAAVALIEANRLEIAEVMRSFHFRAFAVCSRLVDMGLCCKPDSQSRFHDIWPVLERQVPDLGGEILSLQMEANDLELAAQRLKALADKLSCQ